MFSIIGPVCSRAGALAQYFKLKNPALYHSHILSTSATYCGTR